MLNATKMAEAQATWDDLASGDMTAGLAGIDEQVQMLHGPGAGPYAGAGAGLARLVEMAVYFDQIFAGTWRQVGQCVYADEACSVSLVHETGDTPDGARFDNRAFWISRTGSNGLVDAMWTVDLDQEAMRAFWAARGVTVS